MGGEAETGCLPRNRVRARVGSAMVDSQEDQSLEETTRRAVLSGAPCIDMVF